MGVPRPHPRARIHPLDRDGSLRRRLHGQLAQQCLPRHPGPHLRPAVRAGLPARSGGGGERREAGTGGHLPPEARGCRPEGRRGARDDPARQAVQRQEGGLRRCRAGLADGGARPGGAGLPGHGLRRRVQGRRLHVEPDPALPAARDRDRRGGRLYPGPGRRIPRRPARRVHEGAAGRTLGRRLRGLRRAARARSAAAGPAGSRCRHPPGHRLAGLGVLRPHHEDRQTCHRARRRKYGHGLLPLGAPAGRRRREGHRALGFR